MNGQMQNMLMQAQKMQKEMEKAQKKIDTSVFKNSTAGGALEVSVLGTKQIQKITISDELLDVEEKEILENLLVSTLNQTFSQIDDQTETTMKKFTGGLPGLPF